MIKCEICGKEINTKKESSMGSVFSRHVIWHHDITPKEYYDLYLNLKFEGTCKTCGKQTKFLNITKGYQVHCNSKCAGADPIVMKAKIATQTEKYGGYGFASKTILQKCNETYVTKYG